ncbi:MAG: Coq4 family protein [Polyangia bacterium]
MAARIINFQPRLALKAAVALARDPDDLPQVFTLIASLSFDTLSRIAARFEATDRGRALIAARPDIVARLADRAALANLPDGSVGRAYLDFVTRENISAEGIRAAAETGATGTQALPAPLDYVFARMRDTHDLWHVVTGFGGDVLGEVALLSFTFAQTNNPAIALILGIGAFKLKKVSGARSLMRAWHRHGRESTWLPTVPWEALLARPLVEVRAELGLPPPARYVPVRSNELRAAA